MKYTLIIYLIRGLHHIHFHRDSIIVSMEYTEIKDKLNKLTIKKLTDEELLAQRKARLEEIKAETETLLKSQAVLQDVAKKVQSQLSLKIDSIVNLALKTLFDDEYEFKLEYVTARGKTEVEFNLYKNGKLIDPMNQSGGGLVDAICFALRVSVFTLTKTDNVIVMDEGLKFVSKGFRTRAAELIHTLSERLGLQFIEVTHVDEMVENSDKQFVIKKVKGVSECLN